MLTKGSKRFWSCSLFLLLGSLLVGEPRVASQVLHDDHVQITGNLCAADASCDGHSQLADFDLIDPSPDIRFIDTSNDDWEIEVQSDDLRIKSHVDGGSTTRVVTLEGGAPANSIFVDPNGDVGLGTATPGAPLHIVRAAGTSIGDNVGFRLENSSAGSSWVFTGVEGNTDHFIINKLGSGMQEVRLNEGGDMMIPGTLTTGGPTCSGGCDELFQPRGAVESIEQHAAAMWNNSHLPGVGPTESGQPMNLSAKVGGLINELEKAHIYIERLHERLKEKDNHIRKLERRLDNRDAEFTRRLSRLEALLSASPAGN